MLPAATYTVMESMLVTTIPSLQTTHLLLHNCCSPPLPSKYNTKPQNSNKCDVHCCWLTRLPAESQFCVCVCVWVGEGPRSRCYGHTTALRLLVQPCDEDERWSVFFIFTSNVAPVEWNWQQKTEVLGKKPVPEPLCPLQIPHGLTWDRSRASVVGGGD
jgi:hypothetical protein